jgi:hypothetical protein
MGYYQQKKGKAVRMEKVKETEKTEPEVEKEEEMTGEQGIGEGEGRKEEKIEKDMIIKKLESLEERIEFLVTRKELGLRQKIIEKTVQQEKKSKQELEETDRRLAELRRVIEQEEDERAEYKNYAMNRGELEKERRALEMEVTRLREEITGLKQEMTVWKKEKEKTEDEEAQRILDERE